MVTSTRSLSPCTATTTRRGRARRLPQRRQVLRQRADLLTLRGRQSRGLRAAEACVLLLQPALLAQGLLPTPLQLAGHQAVLRLTGVVLPPRPLGLVAGPLHLLLPMLVQLLAFLLQVLGRRPAQIQRRRRH